VALYFDTGTPYETKNFIVGNTICVMYARQKTFIDGSQGIRVEDPKFVQGTYISSSPDTLILALPCSLRTLINIADSVAKATATCKACDKPAGQSCGRCGGVKYCSKVVPFPSTCNIIIDAMCRNVRQVTGRHINLNALSSRSCEDGIHIDGITLIIFVISELIASYSLVMGFFLPL